MSRYQFTPQAVDDLFEIWTYIARPNNVEAANRLEDVVYMACASLAEGPFRGKTREGLTKASSSVLDSPSLPNYIIVYEPASDPLQIIRILHGTRDTLGILGVGKAVSMGQPSQQK